jgi:hypothetical protein
MEVKKNTGGGEGFLGNINRNNGGYTNNQV